ncbi:PIN domain-containing protein [Mariniluteicoccus flavus]
MTLPPSRRQSVSRRPGRYLPDLLNKRGVEADLALEVLDHVEGIVRSVGEPFYLEARAEASARIEARDPRDWPILAVALTLDCPVWTEDQDFFGTGVPTWTTDRVELYLNARKKS